jgi:hypothetical protein
MRGRWVSVAATVIVELIAGARSAVVRICDSVPAEASDAADAPRHSINAATKP